MMVLHVGEYKNACNQLDGHQVSIWYNEMSGYVPLGPVLSARIKVGSGKNIRSGAGHTPRESARARPNY
jgi:hypothetical protein